MRRTLLSIIALTVVLTVAATAAPIYNISTGPVGGTIPGAVWTATSVPIGATTGAAILSNFGPPWVAEPGDARWVSTPDGFGTSTGPAGDYTYRLDLSALLVPSVAGSFSFQAASDNSWAASFVTTGGGSVICSGNCTPSDLSGAAHLALSSVQTGTLNWDGIGSVFMQVVVTNSVTGGTNPTGLLVSGTLDAAVVPEPSTWAMFGIAAVGVGLSRLRRKA
jgi:hypothetical protein